MLLYYITDRSQFAGDESHRRGRLLERVAAAAQAGVDYIQLRERDLSGRQLEVLARECMTRVAGTKTKLLINSRADVAIATGAAGVHLRADDISPTRARQVYLQAGVKPVVIAVSCHTLEEVRRAQADADLIVFGPVYEKEGGAGIGLERLREACAVAPGRVLALGGVTVANTAQCLRAGASGVAGIRLFQEGDLLQTTAALRRLG